jgi:hypothetical protein
MHTHKIEELAGITLTVNGHIKKINVETARNAWDVNTFTPTTGLKHEYILCE